MSGPVTDADVARGAAGSEPAELAVEVSESRSSEVAGVPVRRSLPKRARRTVGAWCFVDHMGPIGVGGDTTVEVAPHPHMGLQTVTWLFDGELVHRDSLGTEQVITPGQLNLMTAGHGVSHSEESVGYRGDMHGVQLWVAQPSSTRDGPPAFEHHAEVPQVDLGGATASVLVGRLGETSSAARRDTDHLGVDLRLRPGSVTVPLQSRHEHALILCQGAATVAGTDVVAGQMAYVGPGRDELEISMPGPARGVLIGGVPFEEPVLMWWNFVGRSQAEITAAHEDWARGAARFGTVGSALPRVEVSPPPWARP